MLGYTTLTQTARKGCMHTNIHTVPFLKIFLYTIQLSLGKTYLLERNKLATKETRDLACEDAETDGTTCTCVVRWGMSREEETQYMIALSFYIYY
jgi:hypothetical protein